MEGPETLSVPGVPVQVKVRTSVTSVMPDGNAAHVSATPSGRAGCGVVMVTGL